MVQGAESGVYSLFWVATRPPSPNPKIAKLSSLEQRRIQQLLGLHFVLYKKDTDRLITRANMRGQQKYVFKVDAKIGKKYERSPYLSGTHLWDKLQKNVQESENVYVYKNKVKRLYLNIHKYRQPAIQYM